MKLIRGDCLNVMRRLPAGAADCLITDPPYGSTDCDWDGPIDWSSFWLGAEAACKPDAMFIFFAAQPFATDLINSRRHWFRYDLVWKKNATVGFLDANRRPLRQHELILVFGPKARACYNPQMVPGLHRNPPNRQGKCTLYSRHRRGGGLAASFFPAQRFVFWERPAADAPNAEARRALRMAGQDLQPARGRDLGSIRRQRLDRRGLPAKRAAVRGH
jgi:hypothetical protein